MLVMDKSTLAMAESPSRRRGASGDVSVGLDRRERRGNPGAGLALV